MTTIIGITAFLLAAVERFSRLRFRPSPLFRRYFASDTFYLLTGFVAGWSLAVAYVASGSQWVGDWWGIPRLASADLPLWATTLLALVAIDLGDYLVHSLLHHYSALWEFHKVHHSSRTLDWLATFRSHIVEQALRRSIAPALLIVAGFPIKAAVLAGGLFTAWGMLNHSNLKLNLRFLEPILITPRLHRLHHVPETEGCNLGTFFTFWDRMRGTFVRAELEETCTFGVANEIDSYPQSWLPQFVEPMRRLLRTRSMPAATSQRLS